MTRQSYGHGSVRRRGRRRTWRPLHGRLWSWRRPKLSQPGEWAWPKRRRGKPADPPAS